MENFKGTKAKWRVADDFHQITTSRIGILESSKKICDINFFGIGAIEAQANAKLISKSKELLETLTKLHQAISSGNPHELSEWNLKAKQLTHEILNS